MRFNHLLVVVGTIDGLARAGGRGRERGMWREVDYLLAGPILVHYLSPATSQVPQVGDPKSIPEEETLKYIREVMIPEERGQHLYTSFCPDWSNPVS